MSDAAIRVSGLGKRYRIGAAAGRQKTLREAIVHHAGSPFRNLDRLRQLSRFDKTDEANTVWALRDATFEVGHGEAIGVIGRNGAGKSTLLKLLSRITAPTAGRAEIRGRVGSLLEVGTGFHAELSGRENVYLNGAILGMDRPHIQRKFDEIVSFAGVEEFIDTPVKRYSSGMYLRLAFAVAAHLEPEILIVDEVLAVGDLEFQKKCIGKMKEVGGEGRTVLFVSHNMGAITSLCRRGILLEKGRVVHDGSVTGAVNTYMRSALPQGSVDLASHKERQGKGNVKFTGIRFEDLEGHPLEVGVSGLPLVVVLEYRSQTQRSSLRNCRFSLMVADSMGQLLFNCSSELVDNSVLNLPLNGEARCIIPRLPLTQSQYVLSPFLEVEGATEDSLDGVLSLDVVDGDYYGTGRQYPPGWQGKGVLLDHDWTFSE